MTKSTIKVLVVDDSRLVRELLCTIFEQDPDLEVIGTASDPFEAREKIKTLSPDVITLDVEMPRMDGITFLKNLMRLRPMPVVMVSTLTEKGAMITLEALEVGAVEYVAKPKAQLNDELPAMADEIRRKVKIAARANVAAYAPEIKLNRQKESSTGGWSKDLIVIGASTGGTEAIKTVLAGLPKKMPPIAIVQHMPIGFTTSYANRLTSFLGVKVVEVFGKNLVLESGTIYLANGDEHLSVVSGRGKIVVECLQSAPVNRHRPSVDVLMKSAAQQCGSRVIGVLLTGMGMDGANGLLALREAGGSTIVQDEQTSVVWGMPRVAWEIGAAQCMLPLQSIGAEVTRIVEGRRKESS